MKSHPTDHLSLFLGLAVTGLGALGLLFATGALVDQDVDLRFLGPVALVGIAGIVLALTLSSRRRDEQRQSIPATTPAEEPAPW